MIIVFQLSIMTKHCLRRLCVQCQTSVLTPEMKLINMVSAIPAIYQQLNLSTVSNTSKSVYISTEPTARTGEENRTN